jgi:hypothetical protein
MSAVSTAPPTGPLLTRLLGQRVVTCGQLAQLFQITTKTVRTWVRERKLPPPLACSTRRHRWDMAQVCAWTGIGGGAAHAS